MLEASFPRLSFVYSHYISIIICTICTIAFLLFIAAKQAMDQGRSPIIIDNTNTQAWEMKPYVEAVNKAAYFF